MAQQLRVEIVGDASSYAKSLAKAAEGTKSFGDHLKGVGKAAAFAAGAAGVGAIVGTLKVGIDEFSESTKVAAQTEAVLKSTGAAAKVTAKQVDALAGSIMAKSGIDDEAIKSGENLLLTFTNVRNEVGKGNDVFSQATQTMADMSTALGQDMKSSALQLGKALNDPIKGVSALQRVGVSFTAAQKDQIKALVDSGHAMDAQKVILKELNKEFGGSAEAAGKTLPGQLKILREQFNNLAGEIVAGLVPALQSAVSWLTEHWAQISTVLKASFSVLGQTIKVTVDAIGAFVDFASQHKDLMVALAGAVAGVTVAFAAYRTAAFAAAAAQLALNAAVLANPYVLGAVAVAALVGALGVLYVKNEEVHQAVDQAWANLKQTFESVLPYLEGLWATFGETITNVARTTWNTIKAEFQGALTVLRGFVDVFAGLLQGDFGRMWKGIEELFGGSFQIIEAQVKAGLEVVAELFRGLIRVIDNLAAAAGGAAVRVGVAIKDGVVNGLAGLAARVTGAFSSLWGALADLGSLAFSYASGIGQRIVQGIWAGVQSLSGWLWGQLKSFLQSIWDSVAAFLHIKSPSGKAADEIGIPLAEGIAVGFLAGVKPLGRVMASAINAAMPTPTFSLAGGGGQVGSGGAGMAARAGGINVSVVVPGTLVGSGGMEELAAVIHAELLRRQQRNVTLGFT